MSDCNCDEGCAAGTCPADVVADVGTGEGAVSSGAKRTRDGTVFVIGPDGEEIAFGHSERDNQADAKAWARATLRALDLVLEDDSVGC